MSTLATWESFYVIIGSSSAALTGLMFVVVTLIPESRLRLGASNDALSAFAAPTVLHFGAVLLVSSLLSAPWQTPWQAGIGVGISGLVGALYCVVIFRRIRQQTDYRPVREDWVWYLFMPLLGYLLLFVAAIALRGEVRRPLFAIGAAVVLLLFIGIHNAWDMVTFAVRERVQRSHDRLPTDKNGTPRDN